MPEDITEARVAEIYTEKHLTRDKIWDIYNGAQKALQLTGGISAEQVIIESIETAGARLGLPYQEAEQLYWFLFRQMCE
ncbi:MAG: hypothetical protein AAB511_01810 [Patescibacteria group bacterium]